MTTITSDTKGGDPSGAALGAGPGPLPLIPPAPDAPGPAAGGRPSVTPAAAASSEAERASAQGDGQDGQPLVTFCLNREHFAFPMAAVREIIRVPEVVRVPLSPPALEGLANLRGQMLPVVNLRRALRFQPIPNDSATRVVVVEEEGAHGIVGFVVDRVSRVIIAHQDQVEPVGAGRGSIDAALLSKIIKGQADQPMIMLLELGSLLRSQQGTAELLAPAAGSTRRGAAPELRERREGREYPEHDGVDGTTIGARSREHHLVSFQVARQEYAFPIAHVKEIVQIPAQLSQIPRAPAHILGVMTLRDQLLPLVSLRHLFRMPFEPLGTHHRIVVIELPGQPGATGPGRRGVVGIVMDAVNEVLRVPAELVEELPGYLRQQERGDELAGICRLDGGKRLVGILAVERLFSSAAVQAALDAGEAARGTAREEVAVATERKLGVSQADEEEQLVVFRLDGQEYGVPIDNVQEIIRLPETITGVPNAPTALVGVVNVRGLVLPVVDLRARFQLPRIPRNERQRVIIFSQTGANTGFIVDSVSEVLKLPRSALEELPIRSRQNPLIGQVANLQGQRRMVLLLDTQRFLSRVEMMTAMELTNPADFLSPPGATARP